jgi:lipopolysaccharide/colanic/teichoic acid biosynthesis glycosyltransferase
VFPFGLVSRATKIDELPQLFNNQRGDMAHWSGPRPEVPDDRSRVPTRRARIGSDTLARWRPA